MSLSIPNLPMLLSVYILLLHPLMAALPEEAEKSLSQLQSPDLIVRSNAFYALIRPFATDSGSARVAITRLLAAYPDDEERIRTVLIAGLETEARLRATMEENGQGLSEAFTNYWADLMLAVASLRDRRAVEGLLVGVDTGNIAVNALADLCPFSVDGLIEKSREPDRSFKGISFNHRAGALQALAGCLLRLDNVRAHPEILPRIRGALLAAFEDPDWRVRAAAVAASFSIRHDPEVRAQLASIAAADSYVSVLPQSAGARSPFLVRNAASAVLEAPGDEVLFYVLRSPGNGPCVIQRGRETLEAERLLGPFMGQESAAASCSIIRPRGDR
jgi:hypothetical protein